MEDLIGRLAERLILRHLKREDLDAAPVPVRIGPYPVLRPIARAPYGHVYLALEPEEERPVFVRVFARGRVRFAENTAVHVAALASFADPGVARLLGGGRHEGEPFFVMEALEGPLLAECALSLAGRVAIIEDAARALNAAHERGFVHGELSPWNIHVGDRGGVRDLGISSLVIDERVRVYLGPLDYMAPEQLSGGEVGPWTDVHALGAILYQLLTGRAPFEGGGVRHVIEKIRRHEPDPPSDHATVPPELEGAVLRALAKDPRDRTSSALDFAREIGRWRAVRRLTA